MNWARTIPAVGLLLAARLAFASADIAVEVSADRLTVDPGVSGSDLVNFTVQVSNSGPDTAEVVVTNALSSGLVIPQGLSVVASQGVFDEATGRWDVGVLAASQVAILQVPARAVAGASGCLYDRATAQFAAGSGGSDPSPDNDVAQANVGAPACVDLVVTSAVEESRDGDCLDATQRFSVTNRGPNIATAVQLVVTRYEVTTPAGFDEDSCSTGQVVVPGPTTVALGTLASGQTREFVTGLRDLERLGRDITVAYAANAQAAEPVADAADSELSGSYVVDRGSGAFGDGEGSVCIITNALRNTSLADGLPPLRRFRDRYLMTNSAGRIVVKWYWQISPIAARFIDRHENWREAARTALLPIVYVARYPAPVLGLLLAAGFFMVRRQTFSYLKTVF